MILRNSKSTIEVEKITKKINRLIKIVGLIHKRSYKEQ